MLALDSCGKKGEDIDVTLEVTSADTIPIEGGKVQFSITSNSDWEVIKSDNDKWFVLDTYQGSGDRTVTVDAESNEAVSGKESPKRTTDIAVVAGNQIKVVKLTQVGIDILEVTDPADVPAVGGEVTFDITSNMKWEIAEVNEPWVESITPSDGENDATVTVTLAENEGDQRSVNVIVTAGSLTKTVTITQLEAEELPVLEVSTPGPIPAEGGEITFEITSNIEWAIADEDEKWITTISPPSGTGNATVSVTVEHNPGTIRAATLIITGSGLRKEVTLTQLGEEATVLEVTTPDPIPAVGGDVTFDITSNVDWSIATAETWITSITPVSGLGDATITVELEENTGGEMRTDTITVTGGGLSKEVTVTQEGPAL